MNDQLLAELRFADPARGDENAEIARLMGAMAAEAQRETVTAAAPTQTSWWKRRRILLPFAVAGGVALTGAAVLIPLSLGINGTQVVMDAEIPIIYTTDNGKEVSCRYGFYFGDPAGRTPADEQLAEFVANHDWTGIGQRIYDEAIADPFVPGPDDDWEVDSQQLRDQFSFTNATNLIWNEIPDDLLQAGQSAGATTDCTGQLR